MDKIRIVNWLLTRKCNLSCDYCAIVRDYEDKPSEYPDIKYYYKNEMSTETVIEGLRKFKLHNPDCFHVWYGGEPLLYPGLSDIINFCNKEDIYYTIITNSSDEVQPLLEKLFAETDFITGLTASVDPTILNKKDVINDDINTKSLAGLETLIKYKDRVSDPVAEVVTTQDSVNNLYRLVKRLSDNGISSSISFVDIAKSPYYDFSNVRDPNLLVHPTADLAEQFKKIFDDKLDVLMGKELVAKIGEILPSNLDCQNCENVHNLTVDSDSTLRTCLRIRGVETPNNINLSNVIMKNGELSPFLKWHLLKDKRDYCQKCNWTCPIYSLVVWEDESKTDDLLHSDKRK